MKANYSNLDEFGDPVIQSLLRHFPIEVVAAAYKGLDSTIRSTLFRNMSSKAAFLLEEVMENTYFSPDETYEARWSISEWLGKLKRDSSAGGVGSNDT